MNKRSWMIVGGTVSAIALAPLAAVAGPSCSASQRGEGERRSSVAAEITKNVRS